MKWTLADPSGRAVWGVDLRTLRVWDRGFESCRGHRCSSLVFVLCCVGIGLCDELVTRLEKCCRVCVCVCVYVCVCVWERERERDTCFFTVDAGLLARSQYSEGPATGHLGTGFSWFPCIYKRMLRWFPCFSCSPPHLHFLVTYLIFYV
jgi:hypothetical protein